ncbi:hypothetical protein [Ekhidna sp.]|uniref:hypothetical protein n=1 Tax=Ekhidna sp. TaxID=2608089 RepID=UPI003CCB7A42
MKALYTEVHRGREIVVIDYSMVPHEEEFALMKYSLEYISKFKGSTALVLEIISGVKLNKAILDYFPEYFDQIKGHVQRWASVGFGEIIFKEMVTSNAIPRHSIRNKNIEWFESKEEAINFLVR